MISESMVKIYATLVMNGRRTLESLPEDYQEPVQKYIEGRLGA